MTSFFLLSISFGHCFKVIMSRLNSMFELVTQEEIHMLMASSLVNSMAKITDTQMDRQTNKQMNERKDG